MRLARLLLAALMFGPAAALAQEVGDPRAGRVYAEQVCAQCHAVGPERRASPVAAATSFKDVANTPGITGTALSVWMQTSHPTMPNLVLAPDDLHDVIAHILSLKD